MLETKSSDRFFLGVASSALGRPWRDRLDAAGHAQALAIVQMHGHSEMLARVLAGRGVGVEAVPDYLDPTLRRLMPDPFVLADMEAASSRLASAIERGERIAIFGDYDVDGAASAALLADYLEAAGVPFRIHIPDRIFEGYGPNIQAIQGLAEEGAKLLVTVDCGTTSHAPISEARRLGMDVIVLDHHQASEILPEALVVNPNRLDDLSGLGHLCAAGVVFLTLVATSRHLRRGGFWSAQRTEPDLLAGLDLVALATVADVARLEALNRAFVTKGLAVMRARNRPGLRALFDVAGAGGPPTPYHLGFLIGPRLNAGGRIGDAALGARLLTLKDEVEATRIAQELDRLNRERQGIEAAILEAAQAQADKAFADGREPACIVAMAQDWHPGVVGLVASRLKERFGRPAFAIAVSDSIGTGSGRSIPGVDLGGAVRAALEAGLLVKGGGHAMAAGLTVRHEQIADLQLFLDERLSGPVAAARANEALFVDAALTAAGAKVELVSALERAGPYGAGNPSPLFVFPAHRLIEVAEVGQGHLRWRAQAGDGAKIEGIAFKAAQEPIGQALAALRGAAVHLAGTLGLDRWNGRERVQVRLLDLAAAERR